jgi:HEAT repeats
MALRRKDGQRAAPSAADNPDRRAEDLTPGGSRGRAGAGRRGARAGGDTRTPGYLPAGDSTSRGKKAATRQARLGAVIRERESALFALHLHARPTLRRPTAPAPDPPDPEPERARIEQELGIVAVAASLAKYGSPPVAPPAERADRDALERELLAEARADVSRWKVGARRSLREQVLEQASRQAEEEDERLAAEQQQLQDELDARWAELVALCDRAADQTDKWVDDEMRRREAARAEQQAALDREWQGLMKADPNSTTEALRTALPERTVTVLGSLDGVAVLIVACPDRDSLIADKEVDPASEGPPIVRPRSERRRNELYLSALASRVLAAVGRALSTTPAVQAVSCVAVRARPRSDRGWEPTYAGTFSRAYAERLVAEGRWTADPDALAQALEEAAEVDLVLTEGAHEITALELSDDPGLKAVMDQMDPKIRSDEKAARASDQEAVKSFLDLAGAEHGSQQVESGSQQVESRAGELEKGRPRKEKPARAELAEENLAEDQPAGEQRAEESLEEDELAGEQGAEEHPAEAQLAAEELSDRKPAASTSTPEASNEAGSSALKATQAQSPDATGEVGASSRGEGDPLPEALKDSDGFVRRAAVEAMSRRKDPSDTPLLLEALKDQDDNVRLEAMFAVKDRLRPDISRDALIKACGETDQGVRRRALQTLAEVGDERDTPLLLSALKDRDDNVRLEAIYALKDRLTPDMRDALIKACGDADERVRRKALEALAELDDERDTPLLLTALKDRDDSVRLEAIYALRGRTTLGPSSQLLGPLAEAMKDEDASVRHSAVRVFGRLQQSEGSQQST